MKPKSRTRIIISATSLYTEGDVGYEQRTSSIEDEIWNYKSIISSDEIFEQNGKFGLKRNSIDVLIPPIYDEICDYIVFCQYGNCIYIAKLDNKYGIIKGDGKGSVVHPFEFDSYLYTEALSSGLVVVKNGKYGAISIVYDKVVNIIEPIYDEIISIEDFNGYLSDIAMLKKDGKYGLFLYGNIVPPIYDEISIPPVIGWIIVWIGNEWYYIDSYLQPTKDVENAFHRCTSYFPRKDE